MEVRFWLCEVRESKMNDQYFGVAAFRSRQQVMRYEGVLRRAGVMVRVISTPRDVAIGCGLSLMFDMADIAAVQGALSGRPANLIGVYNVDRRGGGRPKLTALSI